MSSDPNTLRRECSSDAYSIIKTIKLTNNNIFTVRIDIIYNTTIHKVLCMGVKKFDINSIRKRHYIGSGNYIILLKMENISIFNRVNDFAQRNYTTNVYSIYRGSTIRFLDNKDQCLLDLLVQSTYCATGGIRMKDIYFNIWNPNDEKHKDLVITILCHILRNNGMSYQVAEILRRNSQAM